MAEPRAHQRPDGLLTRAEIAAFRQPSAWRGIWLVVHCWLLIAAVWVVAAVWAHPLVIAVGVLVVGTRQLGLSILMHDAAHYLLLPNRAHNDWVAEWLLNRPLFGAGIDAYRRYHLLHHRHTQQAGDPDLHLSAPFPITLASFLRKAWRDLSGQTGWKQRAALVRSACGRPGEPWRQRVSKGARRLGPNLTINAALLAGFVAAGHWHLYFLLWVLPAFTWEMFITRIRNIGEHACVADNDDPLRNTRTTRASPLERLLIAPYWVNYHLEHHLLVSCPCYRLPRLHALLVEKGFGARMEVKPSYVAMLRQAVSAPPRAQVA